MLQRKPGSRGKTLGKSTGWILKAKLRRAEVGMIPGASYEPIDDRGLHYTANGERHLLEVDNVIVYAGRKPARSLHDEIAQLGIPVHLIDGANEAAELDAYRAIDRATRLAVSL